MLQAGTSMAERKPGRPTARPDGERTLTARLPESLYNTLKGIAFLKGLTINDAVTLAAEDWVKKTAPSVVSAVESELEDTEATPKKKPAPKKK